VLLLWWWRRGVRLLRRRCSELRLLLDENGQRHLLPLLRLLLDVDWLRLNKALLLRIETGGFSADDLSLDLSILRLAGNISEPKRRRCVEIKVELLGGNYNEQEDERGKDTEEELLHGAVCVAIV